MAETMDTHLHEATHDTVAQEELVAPQGHSGDNGVVRPFASLV